MNTYTAKQQQLDTLKRQSKVFINELQQIAQSLSIGSVEYTDRNLDYDKEQMEIISRIEDLRVHYNEVEDKRQKLKNTMLEDNDIDIVKIIMQSDSPHVEVEKFYKLGAITNDQWEYVKDYLWKNRQAMKYKLQTSYYQDDKKEI